MQGRENILRKIKQNDLTGGLPPIIWGGLPPLESPLMSNRITIDFTDEPDVLKRVRALAKKDQRSLGKQLLFMCLPHLKATPPTKQEQHVEHSR